MKKIIICYLVFLSSAFAFDHSHKSWDKLLKNHTKELKQQVLVDYRSLSIEGTLINSYLKELQAVSKSELESFSENEKLAFWITWKILLNKVQHTAMVFFKIVSIPLKNLTEMGHIFHRFILRLICEKVNSRRF